jgi:hypothetical protein
MGGGGFLGTGIGSESGFLGTGLLGSGPAKLKGFEMNQNLSAAENEMIRRQSEIASGKAPSISQMEMAKNVEKLGAQQMAQAASQRGASNPALGFRQAQLSAQQTGMEAAQQGAIMGEAEKRQADQMIAQQAASQRGAALQAQQANIQNQLQSQQSQAQFLGGLAAGGSSILAAKAGSDENMKKNIKSSDDSSKVISEFMDALKSYTYEYKNKSKQPDGKPNPEGKVKGVMAQDLEKSELGKQMVTDTKDGKVVDFAQGMAPLFAAIAELNDRTKKLEGK